MKHIFLILTGFLMSLQSSATSYLKVGIPHYYKGSEIVATVFIKKGELLEGEFEGNRISCGQSVVAEIVDSFKGDSTDVSFFIQGVTLKLGESYMVYLKQLEFQDKTQIESTNSKSQSREYIQDKACSKYYNGLWGSWLNTSRFLTRYGPGNQQYEHWIMPAYNIDIPEDADILFREVELRALKVDGEVISKDRWSLSDNIPMPNIFWMYQGAYEWESYKKYLISVTSKDAK